MSIHRRLWLKQTGLAIAGLGLLNDQSLANAPATGGNVDDRPIRLGANENPYGPSPLARKAMLDAINISNRYPWQTTTLLREKIASDLGLTKEHILIGAGSSEILGLVTQYAAMENGNAIAAFPTFGIWWTAAEKLGLQIIKVPLTGAKVHDLASMKSKINAQTRLVYVCNPNNPTGTVLAPTIIKNFVEEVSSTHLVLVDEAYTEYYNVPSLAGLVATNKNIIIAKTFSKIYGMAGARIGYAIAHPETIRQLNSLQPWENAGASAVSAAGALASLSDQSFIDLSRQQNKSVSESVYKTFNELKIPFIPSYSNFIYYSVANFKGDLSATLFERKIMVGRIAEEQGKWTRVSVGTAEEMKIYCKALTEVWS